MLPSEAPMPPWAATVCERVGNTLDSTATLRPASDSCREARMPEPPAPTITTSNLRLMMFEFLDEATDMVSDSPEDLQGPAGAADEPGDGDHLQHQAGGERLDVVHQDIARADPGVPQDRRDRDEREHLHPLVG